MSRPLSRPEARAAAIRADADYMGLLAALARSLGCDIADLPAAGPYNAAAAEPERDWPVDGPNDWQTGQTAYETWLDKNGDAR